MRRRHRVALRPRVRRERNAKRLASGLLAGLGVLAFLIVRHFPRERLVLPPAPRLAPLAGAVEVDNAAVLGAPAALASLLMDDVGPARGLSGLRGPFAAARRLKADFPCLKEVRVRRNWLGKTVVFDVALRVPVAAVTQDGAPSGWLADSGELFAAPAGTYAEGRLPTAEIRDGKGVDLLALAQLLAAAGKAGALSSPLVGVEYRSREEGWNAALADGTRLQWGNLNWTEQKFSRLKEALSDASGRFGSGLTADLRYFEDGKILVRPASIPR